MSEETQTTEKNLPQVTPATLLEMAVSQGADLDKLEKLMDLQDRYEKNEARKAYVVAMAEFKKNPPTILKTSKVDFTSAKGRTNYNYAKLADITNAISAKLGEQGLNASWRVTQAGDQITVTVRLTHALGHYDETSLTAPPDATGNKNTIQAINSTVSYLERYTLLAITGLATHDMDNDGTGAETVYLDENQYNQIHSLLEGSGFLKSQEYMAKFFEFLNVESLEKIPVPLFKKAKAAIEAAVQAQVKK